MPAGSSVPINIHALNNKKITTLLKATEIFRDVPAAVLEDSIAHLHILHYEKGELIIRKNETGDSMFVIVNGKVKVHDEDYTVAHMGAGDFFGEMSLMDAGPRSMSVSAEEATELICINQESFYNILKNQPGVVRNIIAGLAQRLRAQNHALIEELKSREAELKREVEEQTQLYREQKERAERSEKYKEQFLANMSHEIRTPMNAVVGMTNILLEKNPRNDQLKYLDSIRKSSDNLLVIINDILDLSKIEAGKMEMEHIEFSIRDTVDLVVQTLEHKAQEKGLILELSYDDHIPAVVIGDPTRLNQILTNLTGNAIKFTEKGSVILKVCAGPKQEFSLYAIHGEAPKVFTITFSVADTGIGMTEDQLTRVFDLFTQASGETSRKFGGTGLGLSISKRLIELQGGKISVVSEPGKGSTFSFTLDYQISSVQSFSKNENEITPAMISSLKGIRILLAEDNEYNQVVAMETLQLKIPEVTIEAANDGHDVIAKLNQENTHHPYDLVLMDVHMPVLDGYETTRKIRSEFSAPVNAIPILALTAAVTRSDIEKCANAGMNGYVTKPFHVNDLLMAIYRAVHDKASKIFSRKENMDDGITRKHGKITDLTFLRNFCEGDETRMKKYIAMYLDSSPGHLEKIKSAMEQKDYVSLHSSVHVMKTHLNFMGMKSTAETGKEIELVIKEHGDLLKLPLLVSNFERDCLKSFEELKAPL